jgi:hypothetical protein
MATTLTFSAEDKAKLTTQLGISGGSTDDQVRDALMNRAYIRTGVQLAPPPQCPLCKHELPNLLPAAATR